MVRARQTLAQRITDLRKRSSVSANRLAQIAREDFGLPWFSTTLDRIEAESKDLTAVELLLLPAIFARAGVDVTLADIFDREVELKPARITVNPGDLPSLFAGELPARLQPAFRDAGTRFRLRVEPAKGQPFTDSEVKLAIQDARKAATASQPETREVYRELEQRTARANGVPVNTVVQIARRLFGESLTPIRDLTAEALVRRRYGVTTSADSQEATEALPVARRRASAVLKREIGAAIGRSKPRMRG